MNALILFTLMVITVSIMSVLTDLDHEVYSEDKLIVKRII